MSGSQRPGVAPPAGSPHPGQDQPSTGESSVAFEIIPATADSPGAVGIVQLHGRTSQLERAIREVTRADGHWPIGTMRLRPLHDVSAEDAPTAERFDQALVARLREDTFQIMPHGGPRVRQRLLRSLVACGGRVSDARGMDAAALVPEALDDVEARALLTLARAASPLAIDLLLDQPRRWRDPALAADSMIDERSARLNRLITPPLVVLAGPPNVGKSTLSNVLAGRAVSIATDLAGTTRDYTSARLDLAGLVVLWHDTPGLRETNDAIEAEAIELARQLMARADYLIAMTDAAHDWPLLTREPNLRVCSKADLASRPDADIHLCARTGEGLTAFVERVREDLVPRADRRHPGRWRFDERLRERPVPPEPTSH